MTVAFVHGNPECEQIWYPLVAELARHDVDDVVLLSPPGFGAPTPAGWGATMIEYRAWLIESIAALVSELGPIDLVGHDWGAGHVLGTVMERPDLVRSFATDCLGILHPDYVWHDMAQAWQTPEVGEQVVDAMMGGDKSGLVEGYVGLGIPTEVAEAMAGAADTEMGRCILALYRSASQPTMAEAGRMFVASLTRSKVPGMCIDATADEYVPSQLAREMAGIVGAQVATFDGTGHWWMLEDPAASADALVRFWRSLDSGE